MKCRCSNIKQGIECIKKAFNALFQQLMIKAINDPNTQVLLHAALSGTAIGALGGNVNANQLISRAIWSNIKSKLRIIISRC